jgi:hypothetical protein
MICSTRTAGAHLTLKKWKAKKAKGKGGCPLAPVRSAYQPPASSTFLSERTSHQQPAATSQQYSSLRTNQHQPSATSQPNRLVLVKENQASYRKLPVRAYELHAETTQVAPAARTELDLNKQQLRCCRVTSSLHTPCSHA